MTDKNGPILELRQAEFAYASSWFSTPLRELKGVNLRVVKGQCVNVAGFNGAGKSTLAKLISGVHTEGSLLAGDVWLDNQPLADKSFSGWVLWGLLGLAMALGAPVFQNAWLSSEWILHLVFGLVFVGFVGGPRIWEACAGRFRKFDTSVLYITTENQAADQHLKDEWTIAEALSQVSHSPLAPAADLLARLEFSVVRQGQPMNGDRMFQVKVSDLSGGQRHLIYLVGLLVRALKFDIPFLVLDEALACLDTKTRKLLYPYLRDLLVTKGILLISQDKEDVLALADEIHFLAGGLLVESGTPLYFYGESQESSSKVRTSAQSLESYRFYSAYS